METKKERFARLRSESGLTAKRLADIVNVSLPIAQNYLSGRTAIPEELLRKLAQRLNVDEDWLLGSDQAMPPSPLDPLSIAANDYVGALLVKIRAIEARIAELERLTSSSGEKNRT